MRSLREFLDKFRPCFRLYSSPALNSRTRLALYQVECLEDRTLLTAAFPEFIDPNPSADNGFGDTVLTLSTGNVVITSPYDDAGGTDAGAVYLFDGATRELISTLRGSSNYDYVGKYGVTALPNGNFVVCSAEWNNEGIYDAGAVTFGNGNTGVSGVVSAANSLVGTASSDKVGIGGVTVLTNGNYVVRSGYWGNEGIENAGAVTFADGNVGVTGAVSAANSLVGAMRYDAVGSGGVTALSNGNYVVRSPGWDNNTATNAGAVTFGIGTTGVAGVVSAVNSLVGESAYDSVGSEDLTELSNGNYLVTSPYWANGTAGNAGAVTFGNRTTGVAGVVSAANSLVGEFTDDKVGSDGITLLSNGNYLVSSQNWNDSRGAVTFGSQKTGVSGVVSASNSLVGLFSYERVGSEYDLTVLANGNYLVRSSNWNSYRGAVTFGDGKTGVSGVISAANSLVGESAGDSVGSGGVTELSNGNYVVASHLWKKGALRAVGAVTFASGTSGVTGLISASNSLIGASANSSVGGGGVTALSNGNYVVKSPSWKNGDIDDAGAVTFGNGTTGVTGFVSETNSLVGESRFDHVGLGGVTALTNGNYVVCSPFWSSDEVALAGAVTFGNGTTGVTGVISAENSLVGATHYDYVGRGDFHLAEGGGSSVMALPNGNYVVRSVYWDNGSAEDAGAVTFGNGTTGVSGVVSAANSLVGSTSFDHLGYRSLVTVLSNSNYVVSSADWDNGVVEDAGAVTFGDGNTGITGVVSANNSLVGSTSFDHVGSDGVTVFSNGNYVVRSSNWDNSLVEDAGAVTFGNGNTGVSGVVSAANSLVGETALDNLGSGGLMELSNGNYLVSSLHWDNEGITNAGAVSFGDGSTGVSGGISAINSIVGFEKSAYSGIPTPRPKELEIIQDDLNNTFYVFVKNEGRVWIGSQSDGILPLILDQISDVTINENASEQNIVLTGISAISSSAYPVRVTATSNNTGLIPDPVVFYTSPDDTGSLTFTPVTNQVGVATITVTVEDGGLDGNLSSVEDNFVSQRSFDVIVNALIDIDLRIVSSPTNVQANGEVAVLPDHQKDIHEWSTFWMEIWVRTTNVSSQGIFSLNLALEYESQYISATGIEFGSSFTQNQRGTINDGFRGVINNFSAETEVSNLGISDYLLFARIEYESLADDHVNLDIGNQLIGPYDLGFSVLRAQADSVADIPVATNINPLQGTSIWANPYDLNDDDQINFRDLVLFVSVYGVVPSASDSDYAWVADLNQDDQVNFRDLILLASNYGKRKVNQTEINYPDNYPVAWNNQLQVSNLPQLTKKTSSLAQSQADGMLEAAVQEVSSDLSKAEQQRLSDIKVEVVDLEGAALGQAKASTIYIDINAAGYGWFIDETPLDHSEFQYDSQLSLIALPGSKAEGLIDLWTVIRHELGHLLGYEHTDQGVMEATLEPGIRKLPDWNEDTDQFFASFEEDQELLSF
ncbi:hypothetical protein [Gimesia panareensis]|uniref:hypothetical protein n=1 Tax=Gimesia panareensis TaxID=2527978 RepID=UPI001187EE39|nr:hypothetical protein [Gimesia panareensis]QDU49612.1 hypothetical protein Pan110_19500 [Gimesia panareensis]